MTFTFRNNTSQGNETTQDTRGVHYDEIDSVYHDFNGSPDLTLSNVPLETLLSSNNVDDIATSNDNKATDNEQELSFYGTVINISGTDHSSAWSSSDDGYLVPCQTYINLQFGVTSEHRDNTREPEDLADSSSTSISENSETQTKSEHKYETLSTTNIEMHSYDVPYEIY